MTDLPRPALPLICAGFLLAACATGGGDPSADIIRVQSGGPPDAEPGSCWGREVSPATIETVTERILLQPAQITSDGTISQTAVYKTETRQAIVKERRELWFRTPCEEEMTPEFIASVQRALAARGIYRGAVTGQMDARTRRAIRAWQQPQGLNSPVLSLAAARRLGLVPVAQE